MLQQIEEYLFRKGFHKDGNLYKKTLTQQVGEIIINGQHQIQTQDIEIVLELVYQGWEGVSETDNKAITQWKVTRDGEALVEWIIHDFDEFKETFK
jgi:hypothetical protein